MHMDGGLMTAVAHLVGGREQFISNLRNTEVFRDYQDAFETTTGLSLGIRAPGSFHPPLHGSRHVNAFCALMSARSKSCAACLQLQQRIEEGATGGPKTLECFAGLNDSAVPLRVGESLIGYLQTGQVMLRAPSRARFQETVRHLVAWGVDADLERLEAAYFQTRVIANRRYESVLRLLQIFSQHLAVLSTPLMVQAFAGGSPAIAKARRFITENLQEELPLARVARTVGMSTSYFCKMFRRENGVTFMEYLARERIEVVKHRLLTRQMRVSEAAFAAGFQSLSQFNRVFRRIAGEAPSDYRARLHCPDRSAAKSSSLVRAA